jgi:MFS transporter, ACS family, hexuronate transporter
VNSRSEGAVFLGVMFLGYLVYAADRTVLSVMLAPLTQALGLTGVSIGLLVAAQYIGVLAFVFLSGYLADRYGQRMVVLAGVTIFTASTWLVGFAGNFTEAFVFRLVSGFGEGLFWPAAMSSVANYFGVRKGMALGIFYAGFDLGGAAGSSIGSLTFSLTTDWRSAFFVAPFVGVPVLFGAYLSRGAFERASSEVGRLQMGREALALLRNGQMRVLMAFALLATWASVWQVTYLQYYYTKVLGTGVAAAGIIAAFVLLAGLLGKITLGMKSDSWRRDRLLVAVAAGMTVLYVVFFSTQDFWLGIASVLAMGFVSSSIFPVMQALAADTSGGRTGMALGLTTTFQSVATVFSTVIASSLFTLGVGRGIALDALVPAVLLIVVGLFLRDSRSRTIARTVQS